MRVFVLLCCLVVVSRQGPVPGLSSVSNSESQGSGAPGRDVVTWNQSQNGKYNLQVSLKDVQIIALINSDYYDDDSSDDYEYDYEDIIDKPTTDNTPVDMITAEDAEDASESNSSVEDDGSNNNNSSSIQIPSKGQSLPSHLLTFVSDGKPENISQLPNDPARRRKLRRPHGSTAAGKCGQGFTRDRGGRCRRVRKRRPSFFPFKFPGFAAFNKATRSHDEAEQHDHLSQGEAHNRT